MVVNSKRITVFLLCCILLFQDSITELFQLSITNYIDDVFILVYFISALLSSKGKIPKLALKIGILTIIFWLIGFFSCILFSIYDLTSLIMGSFLMIKFFMLIFAVIILPPGKNIRLYILQSIKFLGCISLITGLFNVLFPNMWTDLIPYTYLYYRMGLNSVMGIFIHAGQYGWFMMFVSIIYYVEYKYGAKKKAVYFFLLYAIMAILSLKVKVIITFVGVIILDLYIINNKKIDLKKVLITASAIGVTLLLFGNLLISTYNQYFTFSGNASARYALLSGSFQIMKDYFPLGVGFSKFGSWYARINYSEYYYIYHCYNVYGLQEGNNFFATDTFWPVIFGETGILGTLIYLFILIEIFKLLSRGIKTVKTNLEYKDNYAIISSLGLFVFAQALIESTGEPIFNSSPQNIFIAVFVGMALVNYLEMKKCIVKNANNQFKKGSNII